jgi:hypothetical protein
MQRIGPGRPEPISPLGYKIMIIGALCAVIFGVVEAAGGWRGIRHPRLRWPLLAALGFLVLGAFGARIVAANENEHGVDQMAGTGGVLLVLAIIAVPVAAMVLASRLRARWLDATRITTELDELLGPDPRQAQLDSSGIARAFALLEELSAVIGPGKQAPGQSAVTDGWIAERLTTVGTLKPIDTKRRQDQVVP